MTGSRTTEDVAARNTPTADTRLRPARRGPAPRWRRIAPAVLLAAFGVLLLLVLTRPNFATHFDTSVRDAVERTAHMPQDRRHWMVFKYSADLGNANVAIPGMAVFAVFMTLVRRSWRPVLAALAAYAVLGAAVVGLKIAVGRPGPVPGPLDGGFGYFPSGHTADTMMCFGTCALILAGGVGRFGGGPRWRALVGTAMAGLALLVGFSLVWLDYHWVTDVLGSYTLCGAALFGVAWVLGMGRTAGPASADPAGPAGPAENAGAAAGSTADAAHVE